MSRRDLSLPVFTSGIILLVCAIAVWLKKTPSITHKPPTLLNQLRDMDEGSFASWRFSHPDIPLTIKFPEIATNPVLWDFTLHSFLRGEKRTWTWGEVSIISTTATAIYSAKSLYIPVIYGCYNNPGDTIIKTSIPTSSGGNAVTDSSFNSIMSLLWAGGTGFAVGHAVYGPPGHVLFHSLMVSFGLLMTIRAVRMAPL